jgi:gluconolactonase
MYTISRLGGEARVSATPGFTALPESRWAGAPVRYPDPAVRVLDPRFERYRISSAAVECIATGGRWTEGPVWFGDHRCLLFSDLPNDRVMRWDEQTGSVTVFRAPSHFANGHTRDNEGRLVSCEHLTRRVTRTEHDGRVTVLADNFNGTRFNAPNDVVVSSDGAVWFTDLGSERTASYEGEYHELELPTSVYRVDPHSRAVEVVIDSLKGPNGLCFSPDEGRLYVVDCLASPATIHAFDMSSGRPRSRWVFADMTPGSSDGIRCDADGNIWAAACGEVDGYSGVHVFDPDGTRIGQIVLPEQCANLCFGGRRNNRLFMAASQSIYSLYTAATGL